MFTGARYIGVYIGDYISKGNWIKKRTDKLERDICALRKMADNYPQESSAAVACAVQSEWIFLQRMTNNIGQAFMGLKTFLQETSLPHLLFEKLKPSPQSQ